MVEDPVHVIGLRGDVTGLCRVELSDHLSGFATSSAADVRLDLSGVTRFDVAALAFLVRLRRMSAARGGVVTLLDPSRAVRQTLHRGLEHCFRVIDHGARAADPMASAALPAPPRRSQAGAGADLGG